MPNQAIATARALQSDIVGRLAKFFPEATPVRIPIRLSRANGRETSFFQETVIEFGTPREVLFALERPLEFADRVLVGIEMARCTLKPRWSRCSITRNTPWLRPDSCKRFPIGL